MSDILLEVLNDKNRLSEMVKYRDPNYYNENYSYDKLQNKDLNSKNCYGIIYPDMELYDSNEQEILSIFRHKVHSNYGEESTNRFEALLKSYNGVFDFLNEKLSWKELLVRIYNEKTKFTAKDCVEWAFYNEVLKKHTIDKIPYYFIFFASLFFIDVENFSELQCYAKKSLLSLPLEMEWCKWAFDMYLKYVDQSEDEKYKQLLRSCFNGGHYSEYPKLNKHNLDSNVFENELTKWKKYNQLQTMVSPMKNLNEDTLRDNKVVSLNENREYINWFNTYNPTNIEQRTESRHFVIGDTHACANEVNIMLWNRIRFNPEIDFVYFVGDYHTGNNEQGVKELMEIIAPYYQKDLEKPGIHLLRGNHEWMKNNKNRKYDSGKMKILELPDVIAIKLKSYNDIEETFLITHAGMHKDIYEKVMNDLEQDKCVARQYQFSAEALDNPKTSVYNKYYNAIIWVSKDKGVTYKKGNKYWPKSDDMEKKHAYIIHGHCPVQWLTYQEHGYKMVNSNSSSICFSEEKRAYNVDSGCKYSNGKFEDSGLSCLCLQTKQIYFVPKAIQEDLLDKCQEKVVDKSLTYNNTMKIITIRYNKENSVQIELN